MIIVRDFDVCFFTSMFVIMLNSASCDASKTVNLSYTRIDINCFGYLSGVMYVEWIVGFSVAGSVIIVLTILFIRLCCRYW